MEMEGFMSMIKNDRPKDGVFPEKLMPKVHAEMENILDMREKAERKVQCLNCEMVLWESSLKNGHCPYCKSDNLK
jgi:hypothetical protein